MKWFAKLERKFGRYAIRNLMMYIIALYALGIIVFLYDPMVYYTFLALDPQQILKGQVWRLVTFLIMPPGGSNIFFTLISMYIYWSLGTTIERVWGAFRFNIYFFTGVIGTIAAAFIVYAIYGAGASLYLWMVGTEYINFSLFIAYAFTFPDAQFLLFFLIPIRAKILGYIEMIVYVVLFITGTLADRIMIAVSLINVIWFFLMTRNLNRFKPSEVKRRREFRKKVGAVPISVNRHRCAVCGKTSQDGDDLVFRFCSKCEGNFEYCQDHLYTHIHVTKEDLERMKKQ